MALIALTSGGDPVVVNRLARRMLEIEPENSRPPQRLARGYATSLRLLAGTVICLGIVWLAVAFQSQLLGIFAGLTPDHISLRSPPVKSSAGRGAVPSPAATRDSSAVDLPIGPGDPAGASDTTTQPVVPKGPQLSAAEIAALLERGDAFLEAGDIVSARLFFERAADAGDGRAAMRMAVSYDAAFLDRAGLRGLRAENPERAAFWYGRAVELGKGKAETLDSRGTSGSAPLQPR